MSEEAKKVSTEEILNLAEEFTPDMFGEEEKEKEKAPVEESDFQRALRLANIPQAVIQEAKVPEKDQGRYISDDFNHNSNVLHPDDERRMKWGDLKRKANERQIIDCKVLGCATLANNKGVYITTKINDYRTIIKADDFFLPGTFTEDFEKVSDAEKVARQTQMAQRYFGSWIKVIITHAVFSYENGVRNYLVAASRVAASEVLKNLFFFNDNANSRVPAVKVGDNVEARILTVGPHRVRVEACGVEATLDIGALTGKFALTTDDISENFPKDKAVYMKVMELEKDPKAKMVNWKLSHRAIENMYDSSEIRDDMIGRKYLGTIVNVTNDYYFAYCEAENVRCVIPVTKCYSSTRLVRGEKVAMVVYGITSNKQMLQCECRRI